mmetsp:Transcript_10865/g.39884  ORF Transcript_10865/g.39884 Transcript_10865/m.39884 type:complete len:339 (+) Transcript_10865:2226-3242(+)
MSTAGNNLPDGRTGRVFLGGPSVRSGRVKWEGHRDGSPSSGNFLDTNFDGFMNQNGLLCLVPQARPYIYSEDNDSIHCVEIESMIMDVQGVYRVVAFPAQVNKRFLNNPKVGVVVQLQNGKDTLVSPRLPRVSLAGLKDHLARKGQLDPKWFPSCIVFMDEDDMRKLLEKLRSGVIYRSDVARFLNLPSLHDHVANEFMVAGNDVELIHLQEVAPSRKLSTTQQSIGDTSVGSSANVLPSDSTDHIPESTVQSTRISSSSIDPKGKIEIVIKCMREALQLEDPSIEITGDSSFFELGGSSLHISPLVLKLREELGVSLSEDAVFMYPTVSELVQALET